MVDWEVHYQENLSHHYFSAGGQKHKLALVSEESPLCPSIPSSVFESLTPPPLTDTYTQYI